MPNVKVFIDKKNLKGWALLRDALELEKIPVYLEPSNADISIALSGQYVNPMVLTGKKVLIAFRPEWGQLFNTMFYPILAEYYDTIHDVTGKTVEHIVKLIKSYETHKP